MKKHYVILAGVLALGLLATGCGKKEEPVQPSPAASATPAPSVTPAAGNLVEMQKSEEPQIANVIGEKTSTASKVILVNNTGAEVSSVYVRPTIDDDEDWGSELVQGKFVLKNSDKALYYYDPNAKDENGNNVSTYDIRIVYNDGNRVDNYFRKLPLKTISQITLCTEETDSGTIPYARYISSGSQKEISTLNEVMERLGLLDDDGSEEDEEPETEEPVATPQPSEAPEETPAPEVTEIPEDPDDGEELPESDAIRAAKDCIGQSLDSLIGACGDPIGNDYQEEPESGKTGYHYYDTFTVSTIVDENGNEIVSGVW